MTDEDVRKPLAIVLAAIMFEKKLLLLKREREGKTFFGHWGFPGGKVKFGETLKDAAVREAREETGLECEFVALRGISSEIIKPQAEWKEEQHYLLFICQLKPKHLQLTRSIEGQVEWFELDKLPEKMIPSDLLMLKEFILSNQHSLPMHDLFVRQQGEDYFVEAFHA
ncbi:MAG TPA: NUDIX domain-containing protein [Candidatus Norongarragalinales archaeon]|nr:NUDIX domain-containing protein [Candidatus Norongarragalinales archaeon]